MKRVLLILNRGFEELEAVAPIDLLRRAGLEVVTASTGPDRLVEGGRGIRLQADRLLDEVLHDPFDLLVVPGGPGTQDLRKDTRVLDLVRRTYASGLPIAAICAAPALLADAGITEGRTVTSFPGVRAEVEPRSGRYSEDRVVQDGQLITSRGAGTSEEFALAIITKLVGPEASEKVRQSIVAR